MTSDIENTVATTESTVTDTWRLNALTVALGDLALTVSDSLSVGRGSDNDVVLGSKEVSRNHAVLSVLNGKLYVKDLDSSNGTFINEQRIDSNKSKHLEANDTLGFASFAFTVTPLSVVNEAVVDEAVEQPVIAEEPIVDHEPVVDVTAAPVLASDSVNTHDANTHDAESSVADSSSVDSETVASKTIDSEISPSPIVEEQLAPTVADKPEMATDTPEVNPEPPVEVEPIVKETIIADVLSSVNSSDSTPVQPADITESKVDKTNEAATPVVKETMIEEVLTAKDTVDTTPVQATPVAAALDEPTPITEQENAMSKEVMPTETITETPVAETPVATEKPLAKQPVVEQPALDSAEHDKTTKTELQEEADPDVLRAKQAATAQFSGTANLGQDHDLGTEGNNAMDQAVDNPANAGYVEKKPSGGWFIWVFAVILIIGLALWLFNMGGV